MSLEAILSAIPHRDPFLLLDEIVEKALRRGAIWDEVKDKLKASGLSLSGGSSQMVPSVAVTALLKALDGDASWAATCVPGIYTVAPAMGSPLADCTVPVTRVTLFNPVPLSPVSLLPVLCFRMG